MSKRFPHRMVCAALLACWVWSFPAVSAWGQPHPMPLPPLPDVGPSPLLYVRVIGQPGMHVTVYPGGPSGQAFDNPVIFGFRPGYIYRIQLSDFRDRPTVALFPTIEVIGTLKMPPKCCSADHPATVSISPDEIDRVLAGAYITKVVLLENPETATPIATQGHQPLEIEVPDGHDPLQEARTRGRPVLVFRLGQRLASQEELAGQAIPGTILLPNEKCIPHAARPPWVPWGCFPVFDPRLGPKPCEEECFHDGGDVGAPAGFNGEGKLRGVGPSDTVAEYSDSHGGRHIAISNRVCLCVPRFVVIRTEMAPAGYANVIGLERREVVLAQLQLKLQQPILETLQKEQLEGLHGRKRPSANVTVEAVTPLSKLEVLHAVDMNIGVAVLLGTEQLRQLTGEQRLHLLKQLELARELSQPLVLRGVEQVEGTAVVGRVEGLKVISGVAEVRDLTVACDEAPCPPDKPLVLFKWVDAKCAQVGDVVTFYLKYSNHGGKPITDVAVADSLTGRLEYVPGTARADRDAVFTTQENEAGSQMLRWEIGGKLLPGQSGVLSFKAKIR